MATNIQLPKLNLNMTEGEITCWFKQVGDVVREGEDLFELKMENDFYSIKSPAGGIVNQIYIPAGKRVPVKAVVALLKEQCERLY